MIEVNGETYELSYGVKRLQMAEKAIGKSILAVFEGTPTIQELCLAVAYGIRPAGGGYLSPKQGIEVAEAAIEELGFIALYKEVAETIDRDCGFLFR